jgi:hypothetical protein
VPRILNLSWGTQSFTLAAMAALGHLPKLDLALFIDTGYERSATMRFMAENRPWLEARGVRIEVVRPLDNGLIIPGGHGSLAPFFAMYDDGKGKRRVMRRRYCTHHWKVVVGRRAIRAYMRANKIPLVRHAVEQWFGITVDEWQRMRTSSVEYICHEYPLVKLRMTRDDCIAWLREHGLPVPGKSSCVFCPYQSMQSWREMRFHSEDLALAVRADEMVRGSLSGALMYVHPSCKPLEEALDLEVDVSVADECETGYCWT